MNKTKFKSGDLVENIHTGEVEMVSFYFGNMFGKDFMFIVSMIDISKFISKSDDYRLLSPKKVKFNLK